MHRHSDDVVTKWPLGLAHRQTLPSATVASTHPPSNAELPAQHHRRTISVDGLRPSESASAT
eukprot:scaffold5303_cov392-Prasinococcus_capsulatus_cf.AAC.4